jgi:hypothetical protein
VREVAGLGQHTLVAERADLKIGGEGVLDDRSLGAILKRGNKPKQTLRVLGDANALGGALRHRVEPRSDYLLTLLHVRTDFAKGETRPICEPEHGLHELCCALVPADDL